ncbi:MAG TPA: hypothetical protein VHD62_14795 [Opitutaceae bacterium]|nr:hypothetical protein [Opitutaceae bacterium]
MPAAPSAFSRRKRATLLAALAALLGIFFVRGCVLQSPPVSPPRAPLRVAGTAGVSPESSPLVAVASPIATRDVAAPTTEPYRMRALTFAIDATGVRLDRAVIAAGRVKAPPRSIAPYRIEFEVYDGAGEKRYAGSIDDPLHRIYEYEDPAQPGSLRHVAHETDSDLFQIRLPEPLGAAQIAFFEISPGASGPNRASLGAIALP